ncbi:MAG: LysM peptidoglycan-binding domain-containing protein [Bacteroidales bacterium]
MKLIIRVLVIALFYVTGYVTTILAEDYKTTTIKGKECYIYYVKQGEGFYGISRKFDVTRDEIVQYNPSAKNGLSKGEKLFIPIIDAKVTPTEKPEGNKTVQQNVNIPVKHIVKAGENLYLISKKYNTSVSEIMTMNGMNSIALHIGDSIKIPGTEAAITVKDKTKVAAEILPAEPKNESDIVLINGETYKTEKYIVQRRETLYSISQKFKTTVDNILECNPEIKSISKGDVLKIPMTKEVKEVVKEHQEANLPIIISEKILPQPVSVSPKDKKISIAVILPFMLGNSTSHSKAFLSYYEGLLLAMDSLKHEGLSADVYVYDTGGKIENIMNILNKPELAGVDIIFGPDNNDDIRLIGNFAKEKGIFLVNSFSIKNADLANNRYILQGHISSSDFYPTASGALIKSALNKEVVFLIDNNETNDKKEFIDDVSIGLKNKGREFLKFNFNEIADYEILLSSLPKNSDILFIATSSTRNGVAKTTAILTKIKEARQDVKISLFGYPEWQTYTKEYLDKFHALNTTIFTRFYIQTSLPEWRDFNSKYKFWFDENNSKTLPAPSVLGFDTGIYLLRGLLQHRENLDKYLNSSSSESIQTDFSFERVSDSGGYINKNIYFVTFTPDFEIIKERIKE